ACFTDEVPRNREKKFAESGIDAFHGRARFAGPDSVVVEGHEELKGRHILIANGARPVRLDIPGQEHAITSEQFLELDVLPARAPSGCCWDSIRIWSAGSWRSLTSSASTCGCGR